MNDGKVPVYEQVKVFICTKIKNGEWTAGDSVPSESLLMHQFGVSRMTVNRALRELMAEGIVRRVQGSGTFVAEIDQVSSKLEIRDIQEEIKERGHVHSTKIIFVGQTKANKALANCFNLPVKSLLFHTKMVHLENGVPLQFEDRYVNPKLAPNYLSVDFSKTTPTRHLLDVVPVSSAAYSIEAVMPNEMEAQHLKIKTSQPCLVMVRTTVSSNHVASLARLIYPASRYSFNGAFQ
jgi:GntR family histidine utilization transcriptional repressor